MQNWLKLTKIPLSAVDWNCICHRVRFLCFSSFVKKHIKKVNGLNLWLTYSSVVKYCTYYLTSYFLSQNIHNIFSCRITFFSSCKLTKLFTLFNILGCYINVSNYLASYDFVVSKNKQLWNYVGIKLNVRLKCVIYTAMNILLIGD